MSRYVCVSAPGAASLSSRTNQKERASSRDALVQDGATMGLLDRLAPHLPYVRRYSRALTGDQKAGDSYVRASLEALAAGEASLPPHLTPRVALYHVFHTIWAGTGAQLEPSVAANGEAEDPTHRLLRIPPRSRQAFFLTALEGFTPAEAAQILSVPANEIDKLINDAQTGDRRRTRHRRAHYRGRAGYRRRYRSPRH